MPLAGTRCSPPELCQHQFRGCLSPSLSPSHLVLSLLAKPGPAPPAPWLLVPPLSCSNCVPTGTVRPTGTQPLCPQTPRHLKGGGMQTRGANAITLSLQLPQSALGNLSTAFNGPFAPAAGFARTGVTLNLAPNPRGCRVPRRGRELCSWSGTCWGCSRDEDRGHHPGQSYGWQRTGGRCCLCCAAQAVRTLTAIKSN